MRIILINAFRNSAGTEVQTLREFHYFIEKGHKMLLITFDPSFVEYARENEINMPTRYSGIKRILFRTFKDGKLYNRLREVIVDFRPDIIHINNLARYQVITVLDACKGFPVVKTIRDPGMICPQSTCLNLDNRICKGWKYESCWKCLKGNNKDRIVFLQFRKIINVYKRSVDKFICPSQFLSSMTSDNGILTECVNNPFDFSIIKKMSISKEKNFLYYGILNETKGVKLLLDAFVKLHANHPDANLFLAGRIGDVSEDYIKKYNDYNVTYLGCLSQEQIMNLYSKIFCVVVPSLWLENYPNTVLEALASKTIVIGTKIGGIPELINDKNLLFEPNEEDLLDKLEYVYSIDFIDYEIIVNSNYKRVYDNNSQLHYYNKLIKIYSNLLSR